MNVDKYLSMELSEYLWKLARRIRRVRLLAALVGAILLAIFGALWRSTK